MLFKFYYFFFLILEKSQRWKNNNTWGIVLLSWKFTPKWYNNYILEVIIEINHFINEKFVAVLHVKK